MPCGGRITRRWADRDTAWNTVVVEPVGSCWQGKRHGELADGDIGSVDAPVSNSQDLFGIGNDEQVDVIRPQLESLERGADVLDMVY